MAPNTCIISNAFAAMGIGVPDALAAKLAHPDRQVVTIAGDAGFLMNSQDIETALRLGLSFNISGMSYGALSRPAVEALGEGAVKAGCWMNTGEGGVSPHHLRSGADLVVQIGTAKNGVRDLDGNLSDQKLREVAAHPQVKMFEIKMSQGAKPGKGGILPGAKVTAEIRGIRAGEDAISPNRHLDVGNSQELLALIARIREVSGKPVGFKAVIGAYGWLDELFTLINERGIESAPDFITVDSADGGTGAAPAPLIDKLCEHGLRDRVKVVASGKLVTPADVAWALCIGADFITSARGFMFALGCIQALQCNKNTCPTGITTHDPKLQKGLHPRPRRYAYAAYVKNMVHEVGIIAHAFGVRNPRELKRFHAQVVQPNGLPVPLNELYPDRGSSKVNA